MLSDTLAPVQISAKHKVIGVPVSPAVENLFPHAKQMDFGGRPHLVIPHGPTESFMLRRLGYDVPPPILTHYDWAGGKPYEVQRKTCALMTMEPRAYVLNDMGTGKTKSALWAWDYLRSNNLCGKLLVLAPLSTLQFVWAREVLATIPHRKAVVLHGSRKVRLERLADPDAEIFLCNHDGIKLILQEVQSRVEIDTLCVDELAVYRHGTSQKTKAVVDLAKKMERVWGMTGSPIPTGPCDAWAQCRVVTPYTVPRYYGRFRDELMIKVSTFKWAPKSDAIDKAFKVMQPAVRFKLDDVVELPESIERTLDVEMGLKQKHAYERLAGQYRVDVANKQITAANAGAAMNKLLQISTGWLYANDGSVVPLDNEKRIEALIDAVKATDKKCLVFVPFKHALAGISEAMDKEGIEHAVVSGDTPANQRAEVFNLFQNTAKYHAIAAHPQCLAHGITLTSADTIIWFAPVTSLEIYEQANRRIRRIGQKHKQLLLHLQATPVEKRIYALLRQNQRVQDKLLELFEDASNLA